MDATKSSITPRDLYDRLGTAQAPILIDVRKPADFAASDRCIVSAFHRAPEDVARWSAGLPAGRSVVVHCVRGHQVSQNAAAALAAAGIDAAFLDGGIAGWTEAGLPTRRKVAAATDKWVTRERPKIDRIACPWLIRRFIDPTAVFLFVAPAEVLDVADRFGATPFDIENTFWSHRGAFCTFDVMLDEFGLHSDALDRLAVIVRAADTAALDLAPQAAGLLAASLGFSRLYRDDLAQLDATMVLYDAFYRWARDATNETHNRPTHAAGGRA